MDKIEKIGNVILDYEFYSGNDMYSEGEIEDKLLDIAQRCDENELYQLINTENKWEYLYHFSEFRKNIVSWIPFQKKAKILEIGSGCGAITGALAQKGTHVDCVELSRKRSLINANRNKNYEGITIKVGNFERIEPYLDQDYDVITLIGVWEYAGVYLTSSEPFGDFLDLLKKHIKPNGKIIIAIENRFGLKYWAGCREDHTAAFFEGLEGYTKSNSAVTFGRNEMKQMFEKKGLYSQFYYPYPDYKIPFQIFSDDFLPQSGMLSDNNKNFDHDRMVLFDEEKVYDSIIENGMFPFFSNSFLVILSLQDLEKTEDKVIYSKYSNERIEKFQIRTDIIKEIQGKKLVKKYPMHTKAEKHISNIYDLYIEFQSRYKNKPFAFNVCETQGKAVSFEYIQGDNLEKQLKNLIAQGKQQEAKRRIDKVVDIVKTMVNTTFEETEAFKRVFGDCPFEGIPAVCGADIDLTFGNIIYKEDKCDIIDYEWSFMFPVPVNYILYRMLYDQAPEEIKKWNLCEEYGISSQEQEIFHRMERHFMENYVYYNRYVLSGSQIIKPKFVVNDELLKKCMNQDTCVKVYYDYGKGLSEENVAYFPYSEDMENTIEIPMNDKMIGVRIDPMEHSGIVSIKELKAMTELGEYTPEFELNGFLTDQNDCFYDTDDPWIYMKHLKENTKIICLKFEVNKMEKSLVEKLEDQYRKLKQCSESKIYYNYGEGFSEQNVVSVPYITPADVEMNISCNKECKQLRIDPMEECGIVSIHTCKAFTDQKEYIPKFECNGIEVEENSYLFVTSDPWFCFETLEKGTERIYFRFSLDKVSKGVIEKLAKKYEKTKWKKLRDKMFQ